MSVSQADFKGIPGTRSCRCAAGKEHDPRDVGEFELNRLVGTGRRVEVERLVRTRWIAEESQHSGTRAVCGERKSGVTGNRSEGDGGIEFAGGCGRARAGIENVVCHTWGSGGQCYAVRRWD